MSVSGRSCVVIGAGVVGLAVSRAISSLGVEVFTLDAGALPGSVTSSRNSQVIHAGIYYPPNSLKAHCCVRGRRLLYDFCKSHGVEFNQCGKLIVATTDKQVEVLETIQEKSAKNGLDGMHGDALKWLSAAEVRELEPEVECESALLSPSTGVIDSHAYVLALEGSVKTNGGHVVCNTAVDTVDVLDDEGFNVTATDTDTKEQFIINTEMVVNCAGLDAPLLAERIHGKHPWLPQARFAKGNYYRLEGCKTPFEHLVYPVPEQAGLGVHVTIDLGGQVRFGPDVEWLYNINDSSEINYDVDESRSQSFYKEVRKYWPALPDNSIQPDYSGVRAKLEFEPGGAEKGFQDFMVLGKEVHGVNNLVHLLGIESPGLTSSLALAEQVVLSLRTD